MFKYVPFICLSLLIPFLAGCGGNSMSSEATIDMPVSMKMTVPDNMKMKNNNAMKTMDVTTSNGSHYSEIKSHVSTAVNTLNAIDNDLAVFRSTYTNWRNRAGVKINTSSGWMSFNTGASSLYYIYGGNSDNLTNFYFDWQKVGEGLYKGKWVNNWTGVGGITAITDVACIQYDFSVSAPTVDIFWKGTNSSLLRQRVRLSRTSDGIVRAWVKYTLTNNPTNGWNEIEYFAQGSDTAGGAVMGDLQGIAYDWWVMTSTNTNKYWVDQVQTPILHWKNYEAFNSAGESIYLFDVAGFYCTNTNYITVSNLYVSLTNFTFTNNPLPSSIANADVVYTNKLDTADYPSLSLP